MVVQLEVQLEVVVEEEEEEEEEWVEVWAEAGIRGRGSRLGSTEVHTYHKHDGYQTQKAKAGLDSIQLLAAH